VWNNGTITASEITYRGDMAIFGYDRDISAIPDRLYDYKWGELPEYVRTRKDQI